MNLTSLPLLDDKALKQLIPPLLSFKNLVTNLVKCLTSQAKILI